MKIRSIRGLDFSRKKVLIRGDFDVPLRRERAKTQGQTPGSFVVSVDDDFRLQRMRPTVDLLLQQKASLIMIGHLGRPAGRVDEELRLSPVVRWFSQRYPKVKYVTSIVGMEVRREVLNLLPGEILFLENLRFDSGEEGRREAFAKELASYGEVYVNECFSTSHRDEASFSLLPKLLPSYGGLNLEEEVTELSGVLTHTRHPLLVIIGGSKLETKVPVIDRFLKIADKVLVTGKVGVDIDKLPHYHIQKLIYSIGEPDILPDELERFASLIAIAGTIVWNGPAGDTSKGYLQGTHKLAELIAATSARTIVGGGDTNEVLRKFGLRDRFSFVSTGGGAMLDFLAGKEMPGLTPLLIA